MKQQLVVTHSLLQIVCLMKHHIILHYQHQDKHFLLMVLEVKVQLVVPHKLVVMVVFF